MSQQEYLDLVNQSSSWVSLCHNFYRLSHKRPIVLDPVQQKVFNVLEFGDDISIFPPEDIRQHYRIIMCWPRQFGKTFTVGTLAAVAAPVYDDFHIGCYGPHDNRAKKLLRQIKDKIIESAFRNRVNWKLRSMTHLEMINGTTTVDSFNTSELQIRGDTEHLQLFDEADYIYDNEMILDAIEPKTLIPQNEGTWGKILMISTPNMKNEESVFKQWYKDAVASRKLYCRTCRKLHPIHAFIDTKTVESDFTVFNIPKSIDNCDCGSTNFHYFYDSDFMVIPVDPKNNPRIAWATLKKRLDQRSWSPRARQEYLGEIIFGQGGMFTLDLLSRLESNQLHNWKFPPRNWDPDEHEICAGLDYGKNHDNTVITMVEKEGEMNYLRSCQVLDSEIVGPTWSQIRKWVKPILTAWNPQYLCADCTMLSNESVERMETDLQEWDLDTINLKNKKTQPGFWIDRKTKLELIGGMEEKMKFGNVRLPSVMEPGMREFRREFLNFGFEKSNAGNIIYQALRGHDDRVISFGLGLIGFEQEAFPDMLDYVWAFE